MPRLITNLKIFVASPSDVVDERTILDRVVDELNKLPGGRLGIRLELIKWETDSYPSVGDDTQSVINNQIGEDYDIFIGILWKRFGTPTNRAESGTGEEFRRAYDRFRENPDGSRVMFYFNDSPVPPSELDPEQLNKINEFRISIGEQGVFYWRYKKPEDFERYVKMHLGKVMEEFGTKWGQNSGTKIEVDTIRPKHKENRKVEIQIEPEKEEGFLDLIISSVDDMTLAKESISRIGALLQELTQKTGESTDEINRLSQPINPHEARPIINRQAENYENFAQRAEVELPILSAKFRSGLDSYTKSAQLLGDFETKDRDQVVNAIDVVRKLKSASIEAQVSTKNFREVVQKIPRLTVQLNHAKRHLNEVLDDILEEYATEENLATEAESIFLSVLQKFDASIE
jgi:hypothetical protein